MLVRGHRYSSGNEFRRLLRRRSDRKADGILLRRICGRRTLERTDDLVFRIQFLRKAACRFFWINGIEEDQIGACTVWIAKDLLVNTPIWGKISNFNTISLH